MISLDNIGISKDLSSRSQKLADVPEEEYEELVGGWMNQ